MPEITLQACKMPYIIKINIHKINNHDVAKFVFNKQVMPLNHKNKLPLPYDYSYNANLGFLRQANSYTQPGEKKEDFSKTFC